MSTHDPACATYEAHVDRLMAAGVWAWFPRLIDLVDYAEATWAAETAGAVVADDAAVAAGR